jgi:hypothetical protein
MEPNIIEIRDMLGMVIEGLGRIQHHVNEVQVETLSEVKEVLDHIIDGED